MLRQRAPEAEFFSTDTDTCNEKPAKEVSWRHFVKDPAAVEGSLPERTRRSMLGRRAERQHKASVSSADEMSLDTSSFFRQLDQVCL